MRLAEGPRQPKCCPQPSPALLLHVSAALLAPQALAPTPEGDGGAAGGVVGGDGVGAAAGGAADGFAGDAAGEAAGLSLLRILLAGSSGVRFRLRVVASPGIPVPLSRHWLKGYLAQRVPSPFLASSFGIGLSCEVLKGMFLWRTRYPLS